jgi:Sulfate permease family
MATVRQGTEGDAGCKNKVVANRRRHSSFPILDWFFGYQKEWLRWDLIAGLITAAVVIPKAMAYATIAGLPVQVGLYTALVPMVIYAVVGTSRPLSVSTTTTLAILAPQWRARSRIHCPQDADRSRGNAKAGCRYG